MDFEFDCPKEFIDINAEYANTRIPDDEIEDWFRSYHPEHDIEYAELPTADSAESASLAEVENRKSSVRNSNAPVARVLKIGDRNRVEAAPSKIACLSDDIKAFNSKRTVSTVPLRSSLCSKKTKKEPIVPVAVMSKQDMTKEIRIFNANRAEQKKRAEPSVSNLSRKPATRLKAEEKLFVAEDIAREIEALNSERDTQPLVATTKSFVFAAFSTAPSNTESPPSADGAPIPMERRLEEFKLRKSSNKKATSKPAESSEELVKRLRQHNEQFLPKSKAFEPSRHSVRDVRAWERSSGKVWATLSNDERETANSEILALKSMALK